AAVLEQVMRDIAEDHLPRLADERQRAERDQAIAGADVEKRVTRTDTSVREDAVSDRFQIVECASLLLGVSGVASSEDPRCPPIGRGLVHGCSPDVRPGG